MSVYTALRTLVREVNTVTNGTLKLGVENPIVSITTVGGNVRIDYVDMSADSVTGTRMVATVEVPIGSA